MGTGIVSVDLFLDGHGTLPLIPLVMGIMIWATLGVLLAVRSVADRPGLGRESAAPAALTGVAGTAVPGTRLVLLGWVTSGVALLVIGVLLWIVLDPRVTTFHHRCLAVPSLHLAVPHRGGRAASAGRNRRVTALHHRGVRGLRNARFPVPAHAARRTPFIAVPGAAVTWQVLAT